MNKKETQRNIILLLIFSGQKEVNFLNCSSMDGVCHYVPSQYFYSKIQYSEIVSRETIIPTIRNVY